MKQLKIENLLRPSYSSKCQELLFRFSGIPFVGQNIFQVLPDEDLKRCRLVCTSWKGLIDDPTFWLKKLNTNGQPKEVHQEWLDLIEKAKSWGVDKTQFVSSLMSKYFMLKTTRFRLMKRISEIPPTLGKELQNNQNCLENFFLSLPPIYIALLPENPNLEVISIITYFNEDFAKPIIVPKEVVKCWYNFPVHINILDFSLTIDNKSINPLTFAIERQVKRISLEVLKLLASKIKDPCMNDFKEPLHCLIAKNDIEMCKFLVKMLPIKEQNEIVTTKKNYPGVGGISAIKIAMGLLHVDIFAYLLSKTDNPEIATGEEQISLLDSLTKHHTNWDCPKSKSCKFAEMFRILVTKLTQFQEPELWLINNPLHNAIKRLNDDEKDECAKEMVKYLAPRTNLKITNLQGLTPIDLANVGARKFLMSCKRKITIGSNDTKSKKSKMILGIEVYDCPCCNENEAFKGTTVLDVRKHMKSAHNISVKTQREMGWTIKSKLL